MKFNEDCDRDIELQGTKLSQVDKFKYLGSKVTEDGELEAGLAHRMQCGWRNWKKVSGVLCDKRLSDRMKGKIYKTVVRRALLYRAETWLIKRNQERVGRME